MPDKSKKLVKLQAGNAQAAFHPEGGAALVSLVLENPSSHEKPVQILAEPGMPICFPFAGRVWSKTKGVGFYDLEKNTTLPMPIHGFGSGLPWQVIHAQENSVRFSLGDSKETTWIHFPFSFRAELECRLEPTCLQISLEVEHLNIPTATGESHSRMPVAPGFHPYFKVFARDFATSTIEIRAAQIIAVTPEGAAGSRKPSINALFKSDLSEALTHNLIVEAESDLATLKISDATDNRTIQLKTVAMSGGKSTMNYFVLWAKPEMNFYCVEPWLGLPNCVAENTCRWLERGESLKLGFRLALI